MTDSFTVDFDLLVGNPPFGLHRVGKSQSDTELGNVHPPELDSCFNPLPAVEFRDKRQKGWEG